MARSLVFVSLASALSLSSLGCQKAPADAGASGDVHAIADGPSAPAQAMPANAAPLRSLTKNGFFTTKQAPKDLPPTEIASFAAGCFWGVEEEFRKEPGVYATAVGYSGGHTKSPTYEEVCTHTTGHAETVRVEFDPKVTTYAHLLDVFWNLHDPTTVDRQGPDVGDQYRSVVFFFSPEQKAAAEASRDKLAKEGNLGAPIVTEIVPAVEFTPAEGYHQQYVEKGGRAGCHLRHKRVDI